MLLLLCGALFGTLSQPNPNELACYASRYPDLRAVFAAGNVTLTKSALARLANHWLTVGRFEKRILGCDSLPPVQLPRGSVCRQSDLPTARTSGPIRTRSGVTRIGSQGAGPLVRCSGCVRGKGGCGPGDLIGAPEAPLLGGNDIEVVVALCSHSMNWLGNLLKTLKTARLQLTQVTFVDKCGMQEALRKAKALLLGAGLAPAVRTLPNVGRCDHSWAEYIASHYKLLASRVLFVKDSWMRRAPEMPVMPLNMPNVFALLSSESSGGFACLYRSPGIAVWHSASRLKNFSLSLYNKAWDQSKGANISIPFQAITPPMGAWLRSVRVAHRDLDSESFWPVCYGGGFIATRAAVQRVPRGAWERITHSLARGDNIEESHFMERAWAALLTPRLSVEEEAALACLTSQATWMPEPWWQGAHKLSVQSCNDELANCPALQNLVQSYKNSRRLSAEEASLPLPTRVPRNDATSSAVGARAKQQVAVYVQVASDQLPLVDELCDCVSKVAEAEDRLVDIFVAFAGRGLNLPIGNITDRVAHMLRAGGGTLHILETTNLGADVGLFIKQLGQSSTRGGTRQPAYDLVLKIHSKAEAYWRQRSLSALCGSVEQVQAIYAAFDAPGAKSLGAVVPQGLLLRPTTPVGAMADHLVSRYFAGKENASSAFDPATVDRMHQLDAALFPGGPPFLHPVCAAGTMFWIRGHALRARKWARILSLIDSASGKLRWLDLNSKYQTNLKAEHVIERLLITRVVADGWRVADIIPNPKPVAFYFPQYHPIPENDRFWGPNFTEWTLLRPSTTQGIRKPLPVAKGGLGYYNLLDQHVRRKQGGGHKR